MPDYEHDIFVSYRRCDPDWARWTLENFVSALRSLLQPAVGQVRFFVDQSIETGDTWPLHLAQALARSRLLIPVLCRDYFQSDWCRLELGLMYRREQLCGLRTVAKPGGLILPVVIDDGDCFPPEVRQMQAASVHEYANPFIRTDSPKQEAFAERLRQRLCPAVEAAFERVPPYDATWEQAAHEEFERTFRITPQAQLSVPQLSLGGSPP